MPFLGRTPTQLVDPEVDINGGAIDGVTIGATSASPATVTTFTSTGIDDNSAATSITINSSNVTSIGSLATKLNVYSDSTYSGIYNGSSLTSDEAIYMGSDQLFFYGAGSERMRIDSSGNVGIGTASPASKLDVAGQIVSNDSFKLTANVNTPSGNSLFRPASNTLAFGTNSNERMRIDASGNVGIGTTNPTRDLQVEGVDPIIATIISSTTGAGIGFKDSTTSADNVNTIRAIGNQLQLRADNNLSILTGGGTERLRIDSSGYIGIANSSPGARLDIQLPSYTTSTTGGMIKFNDSVNGHHCNIQSYYVSGQGADINIGTNAYINTSGSWTRWTASYGGAAIRYGRAGELSFLTNSSSGIVSERMHINSSGKVGIGTQSFTTGAKFEVVDSTDRFWFGSGSAVIVRNSGAPNLFWNDGSDYVGSLYFDKTNGMRVFSTDGSTGNPERMRLTPGGFLGINDSAPLTPLHIRQTNRLGSTFTGSTRGEGITVEQTNYTSGNYVSLIEAPATDGGAPAARIGVKFSGSGSELTFGTSNNYGTGVTNAALAINPSGNVSVTNTLSSTKLNAIATTGYLQIQGTDYYNWDTLQFYPVADNARDLGDGSYRWKDLYLSGGAYLGGTGAANHLDDYEEGTYTPIYYGSASGNTGTTYTANTGVYTKVGRTVTVWIDMTISAQSGNSGVPYISLPFTSGTGYGTDSAGQTRYDMGAFMPWQTSDSFTGTRRPTGWITNNSAVMQMYGYTTAGTGAINQWTLNTTGRISGKIIYTAAF